MLIVFIFISWNDGIFLLLYQFSSNRNIAILILKYFAAFFLVIPPEVAATG